MGDPGTSRHEGQLSKFTNVVKGWQYRWFVLEPEAGRLEYHLLEERNGRCRGSQLLAGAAVVPSEEDGQTFSVNFASGEVFKLRASHTKERQVWVDRLRACAHRHNLVEQLTRGAGRQEGGRERPLTPPGARSHIAGGEPSEQLQTLSLSALDAFGSVHDMLHKVALLTRDTWHVSPVTWAGGGEAPGPGGGYRVPAAAPRGGEEGLPRPLPPGGEGHQPVGAPLHGGRAGRAPGHQGGPPAGARGGPPGDGTT